MFVPLKESEIKIKNSAKIVKTAVALSFNMDFVKKNTSAKIFFIAIFLV